VSADYNDIILADGPDLLWDLDEAEGVTTVADATGNGNTGKRYTGQVVSAAAFDPAPSLVEDEVGHGSSFCDANWGAGFDEPAVAQSRPGTGFRADAYSPFVPGSARSFEVILTKVDPHSFATIFSGSGDALPAPRAPHPTWEMGVEMMRFYANVNTFPVGWVDWGSENTGHPLSPFQPGVPTHLVCTFDDATGLANYYINGHSQGQQGPNGFAGVAMHYSTAASPGLFQVGWRGGSGLFPNPGNTEVFGGYMDKIAVYPYVLDPYQVWQHRLAFRSMVSSPDTREPFKATTNGRLTRAEVAD
jgi:hypothetical protein